MVMWKCNIHSSKVETQIKLCAGLVSSVNTLFSGAGASDPRCHQLTWRQMATLTLHPKVVLTARAGRPRSLNSLENDCVNEIRGRSSATTMHVRTHDRFTPFICRRARSHSTAQSLEPSALTVEKTLRDTHGVWPQI